MARVITTKTPVRIRRSLCISGVMILVLLALSLRGYSAGVHYGRPDCPTNQALAGETANSWKEYLTGGGASIFEVRFDCASDLGDTLQYIGEEDPLGTIYTGYCYTVTWNNSAKRPNTWSSAGQTETWTKKHIRKYGGQAPTLYGRDVADPENYELVVRGTVFTYDDAGLVYHEDHGVVGTLNCGISENPVIACPKSACPVEVNRTQSLSGQSSATYLCTHTNNGFLREIEQRYTNSHQCTAWYKKESEGIPPKRIANYENEGKCDVHVNQLLKTLNTNGWQCVAF